MYGTLLSSHTMGMCVMTSMGEMSPASTQMLQAQHTKARALSTESQDGKRLNHCLLATDAATTACACQPLLLLLTVGDNTSTGCWNHAIIACEAVVAILDQ